MDEASTNNVLVRMAEVRRGGVRFHERFGLTGGEDVLFFRDLKAVGAEIVWSPEAWVSEHVPGERATFAYLAREYFRCGNVRAAIEAMEAEEPAGAVRNPRLGIGKDRQEGAEEGPVRRAASLIAALVCARGRAQIYGHLFELANAAGRLATVVGYRYEHYR